MSTTMTHVYSLYETQFEKPFSGNSLSPFLLLLPFGEKVKRDVCGYKESRRHVEISLYTCVHIVIDSESRSTTWSCATILSGFDSLHIEFSSFKKNLIKKIDLCLVWIHFKRPIYTFALICLSFLLLFFVLFVVCSSCCAPKNSREHSKLVNRMANLYMYNRPLYEYII